MGILNACALAVVAVVGLQQPNTSPPQAEVAGLALDRTVGIRHPLRLTSRDGDYFLNLEADGQVDIRAPITELCGVLRLVDRDGTQLKASDLRIGHKVVVERDYAPAKPTYRPIINVTVVNYVRPSKALRLSLEISSDPVASEFETAMITYLSWLLPADVGLSRGSLPEGVSDFGSLRAAYTASSASTNWQFRSRSFSEVLEITTKLSSPDFTTNWASLRLTGYNKPGPTNNPMDMDTRSLFADLPPFQLVSVR